jgi:hypothetical protein
MRYHYRLYDANNVFQKECFATSYVAAKRKLKPSQGDRIFSAEKDNHEIECGSNWVKGQFTK